jgi:hypothetical protein
MSNNIIPSDSFYIFIIIFNYCFSRNTTFKTTTKHLKGLRKITSCRFNITVLFMNLALMFKCFVPGRYIGMIKCSTFE